MPRLWVAGARWRIVLYQLRPPIVGGRRSATGTLVPSLSVRDPKWEFVLHELRHTSRCWFVIPSGGSIGVFVRAAGRPQSSATQGHAELTSSDGRISLRADSAAPTQCLVRLALGIQEAKMAIAPPTSQEASVRGM